MAKKEVVEYTETTNALYIPEGAADDTSTGFDDVDINSAPSFLKVLNPLSPEVTNEIGKSGQFYHVSSGVCYDGSKGVDFIPLCVEVVVVLWAKDETGKDVIDGVFDITDPEVLAQFQAGGGKGKPWGSFPDTTSPMDKNGHTKNYVVTGYLYGLLLDPDQGPLPFRMSFKKTGYRRFAKFLERAASLRIKNANGALIRAPAWRQKWRMTTEKQTNEKNQVWYLATFVLDSDRTKQFVTDPDLLTLAYNSFVSVKERLATLRNDIEESETHDAGGATVKDDEIPF